MFVINVLFTLLVILLSIFVCQNCWLLYEVVLISIRQLSNSFCVWLLFVESVLYKIACLSSNNNLDNLINDINFSSTSVYVSVNVGAHWPFKNILAFFNFNNFVTFLKLKIRFVINLWIPDSAVTSRYYKWRYF